MGHNKAFDRHFVLAGGAVKTSGGSTELVKGQLGLIDKSVTTSKGAKVVSSVLGRKKTTPDFALQLGVASNKPTRTQSNKGKSTVQFAIDEIIDLQVDAPKKTEMSVDVVELGYNGIDASTALDFRTGDAYFRLSLELSGDPISFLGGNSNKEMINIAVQIPKCDPFENCVDCDECAAVDCKTIITEAIEKLKRRQLVGGTMIKDLVDITPIFSCDSDVTATLIPYVYYTLSVCDTGGDEALALVQAQYSDKVTRVDRKGSTSVYQVLVADSAGAPADYSQGITSLIKGCASCPAGYTATPEGILYAFTIEDGGVDRSTFFTALPGYVTNTIVRAAGHDYGVGYYTAIFDDALTDAEIATFLAGASGRNTATINEIGFVGALCENGATTDTAWVEGETCNAVQDIYSITLPDTECGADRLAELRAFYDASNVELYIEQMAGPNSTRTITLTGTSGTANVNVEGVNYLATFATSLTVTADNFVTDHAATILAASDLVVTANTGVLTFTGPTANITSLAIANVSGNLAGTLGTTTPVLINVEGGCKTRYNYVVLSNLVCEECDPIYNDYFSSEKPKSFGGQDWTLVPTAANSPSGNCLCGIRFEGKVFTLSAEEALRDDIGFVHTSTMIRVAAGYQEDIREGIGTLPEAPNLGVHVSRYEPLTHLGGELLKYEEESDNYFQDLGSRKNYLGRVLRGETSNITDLFAQYVDYRLTVKSKRMTQGFAHQNVEHITYHFHAPVGQHYAVEALLNDLASNAGVETVQAFGG